MQRKSQVAGVRAETERTEARRNRGIGRGEEKISGGGTELSLKVFSAGVYESMR